MAEHGRWVHEGYTSNGVQLFQSPANTNQWILAQIKDGAFLWQLPVDVALLQDINACITLRLNELDDKG